MFLPESNWPRYRTSSAVFGAILLKIVLLIGMTFQQKYASDISGQVAVGTSVLRVGGASSWTGLVSADGDYTVDVTNNDTGGGTVYLARGARNATIASQVSATNYIARLEQGESISIRLGNNSDLYAVASGAGTEVRAEFMRHVS